ncbi:hypothetical protein [Bacillus subtilis]|uniref:Uncharacterized protein n=1 Tax=Bacillus subtilis TaxID=1423 RepID=A0AAP1E2X7_BACIU|nr:hypothetical protein [Bacillus subtilis]KIN51932.1 hypothetical protein B4146_2260 [Bacillus subtilis]KZD91338.1 hypothetical protein B4122_1980 [Bacillus subtilis]KZD93405.1 hypothetical protein B4122_1237 [Bacillus subtilis]
MFKFGTIGAFKQVRNNPRCKATKDLVPGLVVLPDDSIGLAPTPADATAAKGDIYVVGNIIDKPEVRNKADFKVLKDEYVRAFRVTDLADLPVELSQDTVQGFDALIVGDVIVPAGDGTGQWTKAGEDVADYKVKLKVLEKTTFGGKGLYLKVQA